MSGCDQFREMFEAYALGALDAPEKAALDAHLTTGCAECAKSIAEARWVVSQLAYMVPESAPSDMLKGRLMQTVRAAAGSRKSERESRRSGVPMWLWAGVAALLLITLYSTWNTQRMKEELRAANERASRLESESAAAQHSAQQAAQQKLSAMQEQMASMKRENAILSDPAAKKIMLAPQKIQAPQLVAMWHPQYGIVLTGQKVPMPGNHRVLQLWLLPMAPGGKPMPSMTMRPEPDGRLVMLVAYPPEAVTGTKALAITEEPEGGSKQPTSAPRWVGAIS